MATGYRLRPLDLVHDRKVSGNVGHYVQNPDFFLKLLLLLKKSDYLGDEAFLVLINRHLAKGMLLLNCVKLDLIHEIMLLRQKFTFCLLARMANGTHHTHFSIITLKTIGHIYKTTVIFNEITNKIII